MEKAKSEENELFVTLIVHVILSSLIFGFDKNKEIRCTIFNMWIITFGKMYPFVSYNIKYFNEILTGN